MFVELLDRLRCPNPHEDSPLVAAASRTVDRHIIEGTLGCPVCHAEYRVHRGAVEFGGEVRASAPIAPIAAEDGASAPVADEHVSERVLRLGALLGLDDRGGVYVVDATFALLIRWLSELSPLSQFIALSWEPEVEGAGVVVLGRGSALPLAKGCARGVALDDSGPALLRSAVEALAPGGRLVAPVRAPVPAGINLLAGDDEQWVGEREAIAVLSVLRRAPR